MKDIPLIVPNYWSCYNNKFLLAAAMEHGSYQDQSKATFSLTDEDHTLANSVRFVLNQE